MLLADWFWAMFACPPFRTGGGVAEDALSLDFEVLKIKNPTLEDDYKMPCSDQPHKLQFTLSTVLQL